VVAAETDGGDGALGVRHQRRRHAAAGRAALLLPHRGRSPRLARFPSPPRRRRRRTSLLKTTTEAKPELTQIQSRGRIWFGLFQFFFPSFGMEPAHDDYLRAEGAEDKWVRPFSPYMAQLAHPNPTCSFFCSSFFANLHVPR
jgi:hypothetical protein